MFKLLSIVVISTAIFISSAALANKVNPSPSSPEQSKTLELININHADSAVLAQLKGVGVKRAKAIVEYRNKNGKFQKLNDLMLVKGVGAKVLEDNVGRITI